MSSGTLRGTAHPHARRTAEPRVSVVVPALNEARNLELVLPELPDVHEVIVVDGGSLDDTVETVRRVRPDATLITQTRTGKGNALACGFAAVSGDIVVMFDADGSADPAEITRFVEVLVAGADFAKGTRFRAGGGSSDLTLVRRLGNDALNRHINVLFGTDFTDLCYGFNAFWADVLPVLELPDIDLRPRADGSMHWGDGFEIETLINCRIAAAGLRIREVPSFELDRIHGESNLNAISDGLRVLRTMWTEHRRARMVRPSSARSGTAHAGPRIPSQRGVRAGVLADQRAAGSRVVS